MPLKVVFLLNQIAASKFVKALFCPEFKNSILGPEKMYFHTPAIPYPTGIEFQIADLKETMLMELHAAAMLRYV